MTARIPDDALTRKAIFLSASVPYLRTNAELTAEERATNQRYFASRHEDRIRDAVSHLCRITFQRDLNIVFGAHPAISPMVLDAAQRFGSPSGKRVIIFQSGHFRGAYPEATRVLSSSPVGVLVEVPEVLGSGPQQARENSLRAMRAQMLQVSTLIAGVFVGGMDGVEAEGHLFVQTHPSSPSFAIASTGSAAADLLARDPQRFSGTKADREVLENDVSYPRVMTRILNDLSDRQLIP